jgi:hypothetical protein
MAFCDLHNARAFFYKIIELARNFPQQFFSNDTQASRSSFVLAAVPDGVKANAGSAAYHLGYAYESLLVICADKELDDVQLSVANNPTLIRTHARFHELRTHLDKVRKRHGSGTHYQSLTTHNICVHVTPRTNTVLIIVESNCYYLLLRELNASVQLADFFARTPSHQTKN